MYNKEQNLRMKNMYYHGMAYMHMYMYYIPAYIQLDTVVHILSQYRDGLPYL